MLDAWMGGGGHTQTIWRDGKCFDHCVKSDFFVMRPLLLPRQTRSEIKRMFALIEADDKRDTALDRRNASPPPSLAADGLFVALLSALIGAHQNPTKTRPSKTTVQNPEDLCGSARCRWTYATHSRVEPRRRHEARGFLDFSHFPAVSRIS